ncbi:MAG: phosphatidate cytidylyltransferase [Ilumatobacteraceae bacterium]
MSDDMWGEPGSLFGDPTDERPRRRASDGTDESARSVPGDDPLENFDDPAPADDEPPLRFGDESGPMPHWTEPPTGEIPRAIDPSGEIRRIVDESPTGDVTSVSPSREGLVSFDDSDPVPTRSEDELWESFTAENPVWADDAEPEPTREAPAVPRERVTGEQPRPAASRIVIGTEPAGIERRQPPASAGRRRQGPRPGGPGPKGPRPSGAPRGSRAAGGRQSSARDMPMATAVGVLLVAIFIGVLTYRPWATVGLVAVILGLGAVEFFDKLSEKGYRPAVIPGIVACVAAPLAAYWVGESALPLVMMLGFVTIAVTHIGARSVESGPLPNISVAAAGIMWIGLGGSFAALILRFSTTQGVLLADTGTDTLFMLALAVVANDVGALFVGSAAGRTPLRQWISPGKSVEGFIGGALMTIVVLIVVGIGGWNSTWSGTGELLLLAVVVSVFAPLGDLVESMFKRNLDIKDFGSLVRGHGGVLDRFDGFLLTLPAVYYLTRVIEPWVQ